MTDFTTRTFTLSNANVKEALVDYLKKNVKDFSWKGDVTIIKHGEEISVNFKMLSEFVK